MVMKKALLAAALLASTSLAAHAACNPSPPAPSPNPGNVVTFQCDSDNQATDGDDLKLFLDKATGVTNIDGSLDKNSSALVNQNIHIAGFDLDGVTPVAFNQEGNGFAELHSANAGSPSNTLHDVTFTPIVPSVIEGQGAFLGFDGFLGRGQVDPLGAGTGKKLAWDGIVTMVVDLVNGKSFDIVFAGDTKNDDVGAIGFDELNEPGFLVKSVSMNLDATGAWNEVKQFDFSVPGAVPTIPEPSTWAMMLVGFAGLGFVSYRASRRGAARLAA